MPSRISSTEGPIEYMTAATEQELRNWLYPYLSHPAKARLFSAPVDLDGAPLDLAKLQRAIREVLHRHPILRSFFPVIDGQVVRATLSMPEVERRNLLRVSESELRKVQVVGMWICEASSTIFDQRNRPLFAWGLVRVEHERQLRIYSSHLLTDHASILRIVHELQSEFLGHSTEVSWTPPEIRQSVPRPHNDVKLSSNASYWHEILCDAPSIMEAARGESDYPAFESPGKILWFTIGGPTREVMARVAESSSSTIATIFFVYYIILLSRLTGQPELVTNFMFQNRVSQAEMEEVSSRPTSLYMRTQINSSDVVSDLLASVRQSLLVGMRHASYSWCQLWDLLARDALNKDDMQSRPFWPIKNEVMFNFLNEEDTSRGSGERDIDDSVLNELEIGHNFDSPVAGNVVGLLLFDRKTHIEGRISFRDGIFANDAPRQFALDFLELCKESPLVCSSSISTLNLSVSPQLFRPVSNWWRAAPQAVNGSLDSAIDASSRGVTALTEGGLCSILSDIAGRPIEPDSVFVNCGGSLADVPQIVEALTRHGYVVPPLLHLMHRVTVREYISYLNGVAIDLRRHN